MRAIPAIETTYNGVRFRSRTEARWAVFLDGLGAKWKYEHEGFRLPSGWYVPDFWLPRERMYLEIKGQPPTELEKRLCYELIDQPCTRSACIAVGDPEDFHIERMTYEWEGWIQTELLVPAICFACRKTSELFFTIPEKNWHCCDSQWTVNGLAAYERADGVDAEKVYFARQIVLAAADDAQKHRFWNPPGGARP